MAELSAEEAAVWNALQLKFDRDRDGEAAVWNALVNEYDTDGDGGLCISEFELLVSDLLNIDAQLHASKDGCYGTVQDISRGIGSWPGFGGTTAISPELLWRAFNWESWGSNVAPFGPLQPALAAKREMVATTLAESTGGVLQASGSLRIQIPIPETPACSPVMTRRPVSDR